MTTAHHFPVRVYFEDTDAGGVVYHANYLRFAERARTECLRDMGLPHADMMNRLDLILLVRRIEADYLRPARLDDGLEVVTQVSAMGGASVTLRQEIRCNDAPAVVLTVVLVCVRQADQKPVRIPEPWRGALLRLTVTDAPPAP